MSNGDVVLESNGYRFRRPSFFIKLLGVVLASVIIGVFSSYLTTVITIAKTEIRINNIEKQLNMDFFNKISALQADVAATKVAVERNLGELRLLQTRVLIVINRKR